MWLLRFMGGLGNAGLLFLSLGIWWSYNPEWAPQPATFLKAGGILLAISILAGIAILTIEPPKQNEGKE